MDIKVQEILALNIKKPRGLMSWLSLQYEGAFFLDAGTRGGGSAGALAYNKSNIVLTYDIVDRYKKRIYPNVLYCMWNVNDLDPRIFRNISLVYLDISHNGVDEAKFLSLLEPEFKGILLMDDVGWPARWPELHNLFNNLKREHHFLPLEISHFRGTGIVAYGDNTLRII